MVPDSLAFAPATGNTFVLVKIYSLYSRRSKVWDVEEAQPLLHASCLRHLFHFPKIKGMEVKKGTCQTSGESSDTQALPDFHSEMRPTNTTLPACLSYFVSGESGGQREKGRGREGERILKRLIHWLYQCLRWMDSTAS